ncbi:MAG: aldo/keto reductase [Gammaproteobacteria bacterium]|nr:aldo/keto reductase [Gammaproteobacteria bacterium]
METQILGNTDIEVTKLCLGTMMFSTQNSEKGSFEIMDAAVDRGINFLDTAEMYPIPPKPENRGHCEALIGRWLKQRGNRDKIVLANKVSGRSKTVRGLPGDVGHTRLSEDRIIPALEKSLQLLQTDCIDLYQVHWPDRPLQLFGANARGYKHDDSEFESFESILTTLKKLIEQGKIRAIGVSNETPWGAMSYLAESDKLDLPRIQSIQNCYHLLNRHYEYGLAEIGMQENISLLAYSPLAQGYLTGKYLNNATPKGSRKAFVGDRLGRYSAPSIDIAIKSYLEVAQKFDIDPAEMALRFVTSRPWTTSAIFGVTNLSQLDTTIRSMDLEWSDELNNTINEVHVRSPNPCP